MTEQEDRCVALIEIFIVGIALSAALSIIFGIWSLITSGILGITLILYLIFAKREVNKKNESVSSERRDL